MSLPLADVNYVEATWVMVVKSIIIFLGVFLIVPVLTVVERKLIGRFQNRYGPNRVGPVGLLQPLADIVKLAGKEMFRPQAAVPFLYAIAPAIVIFSGIVDPGDPALRQRPGRDRALRDRRLDRRPLLLRLQLDLVLRPAARRLVLGLEVQLPRRDALRRAADLLRGLDGPGAARRGDDDRLALADQHRRRPGLDLEHRPPDRRLPDLHGRGLRRDQPGALRPARGRRGAGAGLHDRVRRHALRLLPARRVPGDVRRLGDRRHLLPRRLDGTRPGLARPGLDGASRR